MRKRRKTLVGQQPSSKGGAPQPEIYLTSYPAIVEVENANRTRLGYWLRYLPSPGESAVGHAGFANALADESAVLDLITMLFEKKGGWTPWLSKAADKLHRLTEQGEQRCVT